MTRREQAGLGSCGVWEDLLDARDAEWLDLLSAQSDAPEDWRVLARRGGFPTPAVHMRTSRERSVWFDGGWTLRRELTIDTAGQGGRPGWARTEGMRIGLCGIACRERRG